jgi:Helix-turn-helix domain
MTGPITTPAPLYTAAEVASALRCSTWWVKEQARRRRIPYAWIGGSYLFTAEHITEIVRRFEVQPADRVAEVFAPRGSSQPTNTEPATVVRLRARPPRRAEVVATDAAA